MGFGVFIHRSDSIYEDSPAKQYQFPKSYLSRAQTMVGHWIIYYEPTKLKNARGYYAMARVDEIVSDPFAPNMFIAKIEPSSFVQFAKPVGLKSRGDYVEQGLLNEQNRLSGRAQSAVRPISNDDFERIVSLGLEDQEFLLPRNELDLDVDESGFNDSSQQPFIFGHERSIQYVPRKLRDRVFRKVVLNAYEERCAVSGIKLINGGGRAEVEAAHILPVSENGPDIVGNGLALSGTAHWMFDRGLISISDDLEILVSRQVNDRKSVENLVNSSGKIIGPISVRDRPHPAYLNWHRENCFKT